MLSFCLVFLLSSGFALCLNFSNPAFLVTWLVALSILTGCVFLTSLNNWLMYAIVLLFTGGMMILFSYMTSLVVANKITFPSISTVIYLSMPILVSLSVQRPTFLSQKVVFSIYLEVFNGAVIYVALYLLMVLLAMVKMATSISGPMKSFFSHGK